MRPFNHFSPTTLSEALSLLAEHNGKAAMIAGGTDLLLKMKAGLRKSDVVVNIKRLSDLRCLTFDAANGLKLGALTTLRELTRSPIIFEHYPALAHTAHIMASEQIRSLATVGGNLCNAAPSADLAPPLIALDALVSLIGPAGERQLPLADFFTGPGKSVLQPGELLKEITLPPPVGQTIYLKHSPRAYMDIAVVGVAVRILLEGDVCREARVVLGAVAPVPLCAHQSEEILAGQTLTDKRILQAAKTAAQECSPIDDVRGAAWYRRRMVEVLLKRGIKSIQ
ncbi:MAG: xanthine dehydrogenase family protein subunit M [Chloroflexota bacterium]